MCAGTGEGRRKGGTPKGPVSCRAGSWAYGKQLCDCHLYRRWGAIRIVWPGREGHFLYSYSGEACVGTPLSYIHKVN